LYEVFAGFNLSGPAYRIVRACPPTVDDFMSYEALGRRYNRRDFFRGVGVSMYARQNAAVGAARRFRLGHWIATIDLASDGIVWSPTSRFGHLTVWAPPEVLLERVVQCEAYD
jgi:hypothetical protein